MIFLWSRGTAGPGARATRGPRRPRARRWPGARATARGQGDCERAAGPERSGDREGHRRVNRVAHP